MIKKNYESKNMEKRKSLFFFKWWWKLTLKNEQIKYKNYPSFLLLSWIRKLIGVCKLSSQKKNMLTIFQRAKKMS